jgi:hypothetical protein
VKIFNFVPSNDAEMLAMEVTPGLLAGVEPDAHQFYVTVCLYMG